MRGLESAELAGGNQTEASTMSVITHSGPLSPLAKRLEGNEFMTISDRAAALWHGHEDWS
jgi:hypothetical protein